MPTNIASQATITLIGSTSWFLSSSNLYDGNTSSGVVYIINDTTGVRFTFSTPRSINQVKVYGANGNSMGTGAKILADGVEVARYDGTIFAGTGYSFSFSTVTATTIDVLGAHGSAYYGMLSEVEIYEAPSVQQATITADTVRRRSRTETCVSDTARRKAAVNSIVLDTLRRTGVLTILTSDLTRILHASGVTNADTLREITLDVVDVVNIDTLRRVCLRFGFSADVERSIAVQVMPVFDAVRMAAITAGVLADTARKTSALLAASADTARAIMTGQALLVNMDTLRRVAASVGINTDVLRKLQGALSDITSLSLTISAKSLSDTFAVECFDPAAAVGYRIGGSIKDFVYSFVVDELSATGERKSITGAYDIDDLLNKDVAYKVSKPVTAQKVISAIAAALGKTAVIAIDDFYPADLSFAYSYTDATAYNQGTAREVISRLFGWTDRVPQRLVNVYLRGDKLHVLQRGKEAGAVAVQRYGVPTITQKRIRTLLSSTDTDGQTIIGTLTGGSDYSTSQTYYTGTKQYGDASVTYVNGLVVSEVQGGRTTTYTYSASSPPARLIKKQTVSTAEKVITNYYYTGDDLVREEESIYSINDGQEKLETVKITRYVPLGQGHWGVSVEVDGKIASTSVIRGNPGGLASPFAIETYSADTTVRAPKTRTLRGRYIGDVYIPMLDDATLDAVAAAIEWLDGRIEERVTVDVYDDHIFDLDKRVVFAGAEYYLERNVITQTPRRFVQRLELVRWY